MLNNVFKWMCDQLFILGWDARMRACILYFSIKQNTWNMRENTQKGLIIWHAKNMTINHKMLEGKRMKSEL